MQLLYSTFFYTYTYEFMINEYDIHFTYTFCTKPDRENDLVIIDGPTCRWQ